LFSSKWLELIGLLLSSLTAIGILARHPIKKQTKVAPTNISLNEGQSHDGLGN